MSIRQGMHKVFLPTLFFHHPHLRKINPVSNILITFKNTYVMC